MTTTKIGGQKAEIHERYEYRQFRFCFVVKTTSNASKKTVEKSRPCQEIHEDRRTIYFVVQLYFQEALPVLIHVYVVLEAIRSAIHGDRHARPRNQEHCKHRDEGCPQAAIHDFAKAEWCASQS